MTVQHLPFAIPVATKPADFSRAHSSMMTGLPTVDLLGANLHAITEAQTVQLVINELAAGNDGSILTMNLDHLRRHTRDAICRGLYSRATLHVADGMPLIWASRLQGTPLPERVTGSNLIWSLSEAAAAAGRNVFLLGGEPGTAEDAAEVLERKYPSIDVCGTWCPEFGFEKSTDDMTAMTEALIAAKPDIVYVALGTPKQDKLIEILRDYLPATWWVGVGISFSFVTGDVSRAPKWMQDNGLEWVHRLMQEPGRLSKRYLGKGVPFFGRLILSALSRRFHH